MADKRFTLIPLELFEDDQSEMIFYHNHTPERENETVKYNILKKNNAVVIFGMDKSTCPVLIRSVSRSTILFTSQLH